MTFGKGWALELELKACFGQVLHFIHGFGCLVSVCERVHACVRACVHVCVRACVCVLISGFLIYFYLVSTRLLFLLLLLLLLLF